MKIIVILRAKPNADMSKMPALIPHEEHHVWRLSVSGELRAIDYNLAEFGSVVLTCEVADLARAKAIVDDLPLIKNGLLAPEYLPLQPYDGIANLFDAKHGFAQQLPETWAKMMPGGH
jgi:hypothetical protein